MPTLASRVNGKSSVSRRTLSQIGLLITHPTFGVTSLITTQPQYLYGIITNK